MNYKKIYECLIESRRNLGRFKGDDNYYEKHHILPKCFGGTNESENLVLLTAREHFVAHLLLVEMYEGRNKSKMCCALWKMSTGNKYQKRKLTSKQYALVKRLLSDSMKGKNSPMHSPGAREKRSKAQKGVKHSEERKRISKKKREITVAANGGNSYKWSEERKKEFSKKVTGKPKSESHRKSISKVVIEIHSKRTDEEYRKIFEKGFATRLKSGKVYKTVSQFDLNGSFIKDWPSAKSAKEEYGSQIGHCLIGNAKTAYGFKWSYNKMN